MYGLATGGIFLICPLSPTPPLAGQQELRGRALLQRHTASGTDVASFEGDTGQMVRLGAAEADYNAMGPASSSLL